MESDEEKLIAALSIEGARNFYNDTDFLPIRQSLYNFENIVPMYDDENGQVVQWGRPHQFAENPEYFHSNTISVRQGTLPDEVFLGALMAVAVYPKADLLENIIASKPDDFKRFGLYTCRFYVEGDWVDVLADTNVPCFRNDLTDNLSCAYSRSDDVNDMWIPLIEKAYSKAVGCYEAIQKVKVHEALMHLTGGSVQQMNIQEESQEIGEHFWSLLNNHLNNDALVLTMPSVQKGDLAVDLKDEEDSYTSPTGPETIKLERENRNNFLQNRLYSIILTKETADFELILLHDPWADRDKLSSESHDVTAATGNHSKGTCWLGEWSNQASDWDLFPDFLALLEGDSNIPWTRKNPNGYFWMPLRSFKKHFNQTYFCKLFPNDKFKFYCIKGEWVGKQAGGPLHTVRDKAIVAKEAAESKSEAYHKSSIATVIDGDASWFNNPKIRIHGSKACNLCISLVPLTGDKDGGGHAAGFHVVAMPKSSIVGANQLWIWDSTLSEFVSQDRPDGSGKVKGQEVSVWDMKLSPKNYYYLIPNTLKRGQEGSFVVRIFSNEAIVVEKVPVVFTQCLNSEWHRSGDMDTTGGPLLLTTSGGVSSGVQDKSATGVVKKENSKWCQNPQFYVELLSAVAVDDVHMKVVVRRTDKAAHGVHKSTGDSSSKAVDANVGLVICKADVEEEGNLKSSRKKGPKQNAMGEIIPAKLSTLKKKPIQNIEDKESFVVKTKEKQVSRKISVSEEAHVFETSYSSRAEGCIYFPVLPRAWTINGLIITPSLSEKGVRGTFELEVYCSERFKIKQLPVTFSRSIASEWTEQTAVGSHLCQHWKKNPKFAFKFRSAPINDASNAPVKITLGRHGMNWKSMGKRDAINCMIGFYVFIQSKGELIQIYDSPFVPAEEVTTEAEFSLDFLQGSEEYVIMPATFGEGKVGSFILTVMSNCEFTFVKEK